jgi:hypothetical protein
MSYDTLGFNHCASVSVEPADAGATSGGAGGSAGGDGAAAPSLAALGADVVALQAALFGAASTRPRWSQTEVASEAEAIARQVGLDLSPGALSTLPALQRTLAELRAEVGC